MLKNIIWITTILVLGSIFSMATTCTNTLQDKIAWDYQGHKHWLSKNMNKLCINAQSSTQPAKCFETVLHKGVNWGGSTQWKWKNAINLCKSTLNAKKTVTCFNKQIQKGKGWQKAIQMCQGDASNLPLLSTCQAYIQNKIAWNYKGSKHWNIKNIDKICGKAQNSVQPGVCFEKVMHGGISWGGGIKWKWENVAKLCNGTLNANTSINCFKREIAKGTSWKTAVNQCQYVY